MVSPAEVKALRERTGAGMMDCKKALQESNGDVERAIEYLRKKGLATAAKRAGKAANQGLVHAYIHGGGRLGVLIEVNCETDFVAKTEDFQELVHNLAMQVAASRPEYVAREDVPEEVIAKEKEILREQALNEGKPEKIVDKIITGRLEKFYQEVCLMEQPFIKDMDRTVQDLINEIVGKLGEKIVVRRFVRYEVGEASDKPEE
ncbi:MAG: translation elongation factor Ts [Clostridia bacterium]|nr:translation elongation factor Ts [Clostridia bacterium]